MWQGDGFIAEVKEKYKLICNEVTGDIRKVGKENCLGSKYHTFQQIGYWKMKVVVLYNIR